MNASDNRAHPPNCQDGVTTWIDPELARLAIARRQFPVFRIWCYAHCLESGHGWIEKETLYNNLLQLNLERSRRGFNNQLKKGNGLYWNVAWGTRPDGQDEQRIYLRSPIKMAARLTKQALRHNPALVETNRPGRRRVEIDLTGRLQDAEARVYSAWFAQKVKSSQISRVILEALWNRRTSTLLKWEMAAGIITEAVYAEFDDIHDPAVPAYAYLCQAQDGSTYPSARLPNIYHAPEVREHPRGGNRRKLRLAANAKLDTVQPAHKLGGGHGRNSLRTGRLYFKDRQTRRNSTLAHKALDRHLRKHGDLDVRHFVFGVERYEVTVMLHSRGEPKVVKSRDWGAEKTPDFLKKRAGYRQEWEDRQRETAR